MCPVLRLRNGCCRRNSDPKTMSLEPSTLKAPTRPRQVGIDRATLFGMLAYLVAVGVFLYRLDSLGLLRAIWSF